MPNPGAYTALAPLGRIVVTTPGTTVSLAINIGAQSGQQGTDWRNIPVPGNAWRYMKVQAGPANPGNIYVLPRGKTAAGNPESILAIIGPGGEEPFPASVMGGGFVPENFVLDCDAAGTNLAFGHGSNG